MKKRNLIILSLLLISIIIISGCQYSAVGRSSKLRDGQECISPSECQSNKCEIIPGGRKLCLAQYTATDSTYTTDTADNYAGPISYSTKIGKCADSSLYIKKIDEPSSCYLVMGCEKVSVTFNRRSSEMTILPIQFTEEYDAYEVVSKRYDSERVVLLKVYGQCPDVSSKYMNAKEFNDRTIVLQ